LAAEGKGGGAAAALTAAGAAAEEDKQRTLRAKNTPKALRIISHSGLNDVFERGRLKKVLKNLEFGGAVPVEQKKGRARSACTPRRAILSCKAH